LCGHKYEGEELNTLYENFLIVANEKKEVNDEDLISLAVNLQILQR